MSGVSILLREKAPYLVTLLVAALVWTITHLVDRAIESPLLEYRMVQVYEKVTDQKSITLTVTNVTRTFKLDGLHFAFVLADPKSGTFLNDKGDCSLLCVRFHPPARELSSKVISTNADEEVSFLIERLNPGATAELRATVKGDPTIVLGFDSTEDAVLLVSPSLQTWLLRYEFSLLLGFLTLWVISIPIALYVVGKAETGTPGT